MTDPQPPPSRRAVLQSGASLAATVGLAPWALARPERAGRQDHDVLRVGLVGCGGRGTGAAAQALRADPDTQLVALGDAFPDQVQKCLQSLESTPDVGPRVRVDEAHRFAGWDAYERVIDSSDVVLLATSPHFRPLHVAYAVAKGRHLFVEKPVATDAVGLRSIRESCRRAAEQGTSVVSGLCYRYQHAKRETLRRVHEGALGQVRTMQCTYNTGELWHRGHRPEWSEMEYQMRNWLYFTWLSGDHIAEQHIHSLDKLAWAMGDVYPVRATSSGGRIKRTDPKFGNIYDHFNTVYEWENGVVGFSSCRQWSGCASNVSDYVYGTEGVASLQRHWIQRDDGSLWRYQTPAAAPWTQRRGAVDDMYQNEHDALFWSIRAGQPIDDGETMCNSTLMAIMARMSAYTGKTVSWEEVSSSTLDLAPEAYEWGDAPQRPVAMPGVTKFV